jgi:hypothetical protein
MSNFAGQFRTSQEGSLIRVIVIGRKEYHYASRVEMRYPQQAVEDGCGRPAVRRLNYGLAWRDVGQFRLIERLMLLNDCEDGPVGRKRRSEPRPSGSQQCLPSK